LFPLDFQWWFCGVATAADVFPTKARDQSAMSKLQMTLENVRELIGGGEIVGDPSFFCSSVASLHHAGPEQLSFAKDHRYFDEASRSRAGALLVPDRIKGSTAHQLVVENPFMLFGKILQYIAQLKRQQPSGIHANATVSASAKIGHGVTIGPGAVICDEVEVGDRAIISANTYIGQRSIVGTDCVLHPNVVIMEDVTLGERVIIHGGAVVGSDGFGYLQHDHTHIKIPQVGEIVIGDDVEIGAAATIDRAAIDTTTIGRGTKIGDLAHIGHNCKVGEDVLLLPTVAVSGSVSIGNRAVLAGRAGTSDNITVGEDAVLGGTCVAYKDVNPGAVMWGNPARDMKQQMRIEASLSKLPNMRRDLSKIKKKLDMA
jgi:UDP-3-O-[3-hydroxymyristoyl] glucosamine N-acyltransferase